jgi:integrase
MQKCSDFISRASNKLYRAFSWPGLRVKQPHKSHRSRGIGHRGRREVNALSFHSLRRTATTWLHEAGVADAVAQSLIGHSSKAVHDTYISVGREALRTPGLFERVLPDLWQIWASQQGGES